MMEKYFEVASNKFFNGQKLEDCKPDLHFQTGVTVEKQEKARDHYEMVKKHVSNEEDLPFSKFPPEYDSKWRFFWPIGDRGENTKLKVPKVYPQEFPEWEQKMDKWGNMMIEGCKTAA